MFSVFPPHLIGAFEMGILLFYSASSCNHSIHYFLPLRQLQGPPTPCDCFGSQRSIPDYETA